MASIQKVVDRSKLKPRREPYWSKISTGNYLGYRIMPGSAGGTWVARSFDTADGKQKYRALGAFDDLPDSVRFDAASRAAQEWFAHLGKGGTATVYTVADACNDYVKAQRRKRGNEAAQGAEDRFKRYVVNDPRLAKTEVAKLTRAQLEKWKHSLEDRPVKAGSNRGGKRTPGTLNRDITPFRAALNLALDAGHVTSDAAWRVVLRPVEGADGRREIYLTPEQRRKFVECANEEVRGLFRVLAQLPLRPGALAALTVADYDKRTQMLNIRRDKAGHKRKVGLPLATAELFDEACKGKLPGAPIFGRADGTAWHKDAWKGPAKRAAKAAELPAGTVLYVLRHSTISALVEAGEVSLLTIAQLSGTSLRMIEKHYGHLSPGVARNALARLAL